MVITIDGIIECFKKQIYNKTDKLNGIHAESKCKYAQLINLPLGDIILCNKMRGGKLPYKIPFLTDKEVCVATNFDLKLEGHIIGGSRINPSKIDTCLNKENYGKDTKLIDISRGLIDYKEKLYSKK